jgi:CheY-like chemotaxis protein
METSASTTPPRILIVEDDTSLRRLLELRLSIDGYETRSAGDGAVALQVLSTWIPDVLLTDVMMPRLSGLSLSRAVRRDERTAAIPIILLTARCFDNDIQEVIDLGGVTFMTKPFAAEALNHALHEALAARPFPGNGVGAHHAA